MGKRSVFVASYNDGEGKRLDSVTVHRTLDGTNRIEVSNVELLFKQALDRDGHLIGHSKILGEVSCSELSAIRFVFDQIATRRDEELRYDSVYFTVVEED